MTLDEAASRPIPSADELDGRWSLVPNPNPATEAERQAALAKPGFGTQFTDHMARASYRNGEWADRRIESYGPLSIDPAAAVLHYGQEIFEGLKAYHHDDGGIWTFRPSYNAHRFNASARRLAMPELDPEDFLASIVGLVRADRDWVPEGEGTSLYLRPYAFASEPFLGVRAAREIDYLVIASPSGAYFTGGLSPIDIWVTRKYHRAGPGGMGAAKTGGNYASSLLAKEEMAKSGFDEVCFLDAKSAEIIDELGGMNVFVVRADGSVVTPALSGTILAGGTRSAILTLLRDRGIKAEETSVRLDDLIADIRSGNVVEMFACGTAAVVTPIGRLAGDDFDVSLEAGDITRSIHAELTDIQLGRAEDRHGWNYRLV